MIEGVGDHGCEYMTRGIAVILGPTGKNFGAGMTGGVAYYSDLEDSALKRNLNPELVLMEALTDETDVVLVKELVYKHLERTESDLAKEILAIGHLFNEVLEGSANLRTICSTGRSAPGQLIEKATSVDK